MDKNKFLNDLLEISSIDNIKNLSNEETEKLCNNIEIMFQDYCKSTERCYESSSLYSPDEKEKLTEKLNESKESVEKVKQKIVYNNERLNKLGAISAKQELDEIMIGQELLSKYVKLVDGIFDAIEKDNIYVEYILFRSFLELKWKILLFSLSNPEGRDFYLDFQEYIKVTNQIKIKDSDERFVALGKIVISNIEKKWKCIRLSNETKWIYGISKINDFKIKDRSGDYVYLQNISNVCEFLKNKGLVINDYDKYQYLCQYTHTDYCSEFGYGDHKTFSQEKAVGRDEEILEEINVFSLFLASNEKELESVLVDMNEV